MLRRSAWTRPRSRRFIAAMTSAPRPKSIEQSARHSNRPARSPMICNSGLTASSSAAPTTTPAAGHRSASAATGHKATGFVGYQVTFAVLVKLANASPKDTPPGYICGLSVDPASHHPGHAANKAVEAALAIAPGITESSADMGISQLGEVFVRRCTNCDSMSSGPEVHRGAHGGDRGRHRQAPSTPNRCRRMFFSMWLPDGFKQVPKGSPPSNSKTGMSSGHGSDGPNPALRQRRTCNSAAPNAPDESSPTSPPTARTHDPTRSAPSMTITDHADECCKGLVTIPVDKLDHWQPTPWGNRA